MGTYFTIEVYCESSKQANKALDKAFRTLRKYDQLLSHYNPNSELSKVLKSAHHYPTPLSPALFQAIKESLDYSQRTAGYFDITIAPLVQLWGFKDKDFKKPTHPQIQQVLQGVGYHLIDLNPQILSLKLNQPDVTLDFGAIGKGQAIDQAVKDLRQAGIKAGRIDSTSSQYYLGHPPHQQFWLVMLPHPQKKNAITTLKVKNQAVSTSGTDQQFFVHQGQHFSHIINPKTGYPDNNNILSSTVVSSQATASDALSTALMLMTPAQIKQTLQQFPETYALRLIKNAGEIQIENY